MSASAHTRWGATASKRDCASKRVADQRRLLDTQFVHGLQHMRPWRLFARHQGRFPSRGV
jgi:hypothetical protein